jgi:hypothetical protein
MVSLMQSSICLEAFLLFFQRGRCETEKQRENKIYIVNMSYLQVVVMVRELSNLLAEKSDFLFSHFQSPLGTLMDKHDYRFSV